MEDALKVSPFARTGGELCAIQAAVAVGIQFQKERFGGFGGLRSAPFSKGDLAVTIDIEFPEAFSGEVICKLAGCHKTVLIGIQRAELALPRGRARRQTDEGDEWECVFRERGIGRC